MKILVLSVLIAVASIAHAQEFKFTPKWQLNKPINLDYTYYDLEDKKDGERKFDTIHADIQMMLVREDDNFCYFDWKYTSYYQEMTDNSTTYKKMTGPVIAKFVTQAPIQFKVDKADWEVKLLNEETIDSLKDIAIAEALAARPKKENADEDEEGGAELVLGMGVSTQLEKKVYAVISDYFTLYENKKLVLNKKTDIAETMGEKDMKDVSKMVGSMEGYMLLDDKDASVYNFHTEIKMDMSKMMNMFAELAKNLDKDKKKKGKKNEIPELSNAPINTFTTIDVQINKGDMLMQYFMQTVTMDAKDTWIASSGDMKKILRVKP